MARVVVTGGEGFIGRHLSAALVARGDEVTVIGRPGAAPVPTQQRVEVLRIGLTDRAALDSILTSREIDVIYHLASNTKRRTATDLSDWPDSVTEDVAALVTLVVAAASTQRPPRVLVRAGSIAEYGRAPLPHREDGLALPTSAYGTALLAGTTYLRAMAPSLPFPVVTARLALTYGPDQSPDFLAARLMTDLSRGQRVTVKRPEDRRSVIHVHDVVQALLMLADKPIGLVNVATDDAPSMRQLAQLVAELAGADPELVHFGAMTGPPDILQLDTRLMQTALGWTARYDLRAGIGHCLAHMQTACPVL